jgi:branched-chain amino acid transport system substrate-binding protein
MKATKTLKTLAIASLGALALAGQAHAQAQQPIKVGVIFPLSGGAGPQGQHVTQAIQAMAAIINESGGVMGRQIEILSRDDESTPAVGVSRANELISLGVSLIIEGWNSPVTLAMQPVISRANILDITAISKADPILSGEIHRRHQGQARCLHDGKRRLRKRRAGIHRGRAQEAQLRL